MHVRNRVFMVFLWGDRILRWLSNTINNVQPCKLAYSSSYVPMHQRALISCCCAVAWGQYSSQHANRFVQQSPRDWCAQRKTRFLGAKHFPPLASETFDCPIFHRRPKNECWSICFATGDIYEFQQNVRSHSWRVFSFFIIYSVYFSSKACFVLGGLFLKSPYVGDMFFEAPFLVQLWP